ncbi:MAG: hypothetical protein KAR25_05130 [Methanosarcinales archaeon]|nr:hypothetical protein [Methanosarcinales archaeon]
MMRRRMGSYDAYAAVQPGRMGQTAALLQMPAENKFIGATVYIGRK